MATEWHRMVNEAVLLDDGATDRFQTFITNTIKGLEKNAAKLAKSEFKDNPEQDPQLEEAITMAKKLSEVVDAYVDATLMLGVMTTESDLERHRSEIIGISSTLNQTLESTFNRVVHFHEPNNIIQMGKSAGVELRISQHFETVISNAHGGIAQSMAAEQAQQLADMEIMPEKTAGVDLNRLDPFQTVQAEPSPYDNPFDVTRQMPWTAREPDPEDLADLLPKKLSDDDLKGALNDKWEKIQAQFDSLNLRTKAPLENALTQFKNAVLDEQSSPELIQSTMQQFMGEIEDLKNKYISLFLSSEGKMRGAHEISTNLIELRTTVKQFETVFNQYEDQLDSIYFGKSMATRPSDVPVGDLNQEVEKINRERTVYHQNAESVGREINREGKQLSHVGHGSVLDTHAYQSYLTQLEDHFNSMKQNMTALITKIGKLLSHETSDPKDKTVKQVLSQERDQLRGELQQAQKGLEACQAAKEIIQDQNALQHKKEDLNTLLDDKATRSQRKTVEAVVAYHTSEEEIKGKVDRLGEKLGEGPHLIGETFGVLKKAMDGIPQHNEKNTLAIFSAKRETIVEAKEKPSIRPR